MFRPLLDVTIDKVGERIMSPIHHRVGDAIPETVLNHIDDSVFWKVWDGISPVVHHMTDVAELHAWEIEHGVSSERKEGE